MTKPDFLSKYAQEVITLKHLIGKAAETDLNWRPRPDMLSSGQVIQHLCDGIADAIDCMKTNTWPFDENTQLPTVEQFKTIASIPEAQAALDKDLSETERRLADVSEVDFGAKFVSTPWGTQGAFWYVAYFFIEHLQMHKMQLFLYLRLQGLPLNTMDLYMG